MRGWGELCAFLSGSVPPAPHLMPVHGVAGVQGMLLAQRFWGPSLLVVSTQVSVDQRSFIWPLHQPPQQSKGKWHCFRFSSYNTLSHAYCFSAAIPVELWFCVQCFLFSLTCHQFVWVREMLFFWSQEQSLLPYMCPVLPVAMQSFCCSPPHPLHHNNV